MIRSISFKLKILFNALYLGYAGWFFFLLFKQLSWPHNPKHILGFSLLGLIGIFFITKVFNEVWFVWYDESNEKINFIKTFRNFSIKVKDIVEIQTGKTLEFKYLYFTFRTSNSSFQVYDMENLIDIIRIIRKSSPRIRIIDPYDLT